MRNKCETLLAMLFGILLIVVPMIVWDESNATDDRYEAALDSTVSSGISVGVDVRSGLIGHWTFEEGDELRDLTGHFGDLSLSGGAEVNEGVLDIDPNQAAISDLYSGPAISEKTMVVWLEMDDLAPRAGAALSIEQLDDQSFDAIVFHELETNRWMAGSDFYNRTTPFDPGFAETDTGELIQIAISYEDLGGGFVQIRLYRNGAELGSYSTGQMRIWDSGVIAKFGPRHGTLGSIDAQIHEARIYNQVLDSESLLALSMVKKEPNTHLVGHWNFDDGTARDSSGFGNHGIISGAGITEGVLGSALDLTGTGDFVSIVNSTSLQSAEFTVAYWAKLSVLHSPVIVTKRSANGFGDAWQASVTSFGTGQNLQVCLFVPTPGCWYSPDLLPDPVGRWMHVAHTYDGSMVRQYADGLLVHSLAVSYQPELGTADITFGAHPNGDSEYDGLLDEVQIYDTVLSASEVASLAASRGLLINDISDSGMPLQAAKASEPANGTAHVGADGSLRYLPNSGYVGTDSFTYTVQDGTGVSNPAIVTVEVGLVCQPGSYLAQPEDLSCTLSPAGSFVPNAGATDYLACPAGTDSNPGAIECEIESEVLAEFTFENVVAQTNGGVGPLSAAATQLNEAFSSGQFGWTDLDGTFAGFVEQGVHNWVTNVFLARGLGPVGSDGWTQLYVDLDAKSDWSLTGFSMRVHHNDYPSMGFDVIAVQGSTSTLLGSVVSNCTTYPDCHRSFDLSDAPHLLAAGPVRLVIAPQFLTGSAFIMVDDVRIEGAFQDVNVTPTCLAGTYLSEPDAAACTDAPPGTYVADDGATEFNFCAMGTFQPLPGQTACVEASAGTFVDFEGAANATVCEPGAYQSLNGQAFCLDASAGTFVDFPGAASAVSCELGTYQPNSGETSCLTADPGTFVGSIGAVEARACGRGTYQPLPGQASCIKAPPGSFVDSIGAVESTLCPAGFSSGLGEVECLVVPQITGINFFGSSTIVEGESVDIAALFTGGLGSIDQGIGAVQNAERITLSPTVSTTYVLTVTNTLGTVRTKFFNVLVQKVPPVVTSITPGFGPEYTSTSVTILGSGFTDVHRIYSGSNSQPDFWSFTVISDTEIQATSPSISSGVRDITITKSGAVPGVAKFNFIGAPWIADFTPKQASLGGGTEVTITGGSFTDATEVKIGEVLPNFTVISDSEIVVETVPTLYFYDYYRVEVTTPFGSSNSSAFFSYGDAPVITSVAYLSGATTGGLQNWIYGENFCTTSLTVLLGDETITPHSVRCDVISFFVPPGAAGTVPFTVVSKFGSSASDPSASYTYIKPPVVASLIPSSGPTSGGTTVTITGSDLGGASEVRFGSKYATITSNTENSITVVNPDGLLGVADVTVRNSVATSAVSPASQFVYATPAPTVSKAIPNQVSSLGGSAVRIFGNGFTNVTSVSFGTTPAADFTLVSDQEILATSPLIAGGEQNIFVTTAAGVNSTSPTFRFIAPPVITAVTPAQGPTAGGATVEITGTGLANSQGVLFGDNQTNAISVNTDTRIVVRSTGGSAGEVNIRVIGIYETSDVTAAARFTYRTPPTLVSINPSAVSTLGGSLVTIGGTNLSEATRVTIGGVDVPIVANNGDSIEVIAPPNAAGTLKVNVFTPFGTHSNNAANDLQYVLPTTVTGINPALGSIEGGATVTITGNILVASKVMFGDNEAALITNTNPGSVTVIAPAGQVGIVDVTVTSCCGGGTSAATAAAQYTYVAPPLISAVSQLTGPASGGSSVTIMGQALGSATAVKFGGLDGVIVSNTDTSITVLTPAATMGAADLQVITPYGASLIDPAFQFIYVGLPTIDSISLSSGALIGGETVLINGSSFSNAVSVLFGSSPATSFSVSSDNQIVAIAPAGTAGSVGIQVSTLVGGTSVVEAIYTYVAPPAVTRMNTSVGTTNGGTQVVIEGVKFAGATSVTFAGVPAVITANDGASISVLTPIGAEGIAEVIVSTPYGSDSAGGFTYLAPPMIVELNPAAGSRLGGGVMTLAGTRLESVTSVTFGGVPADIISITDTLISLYVPAGAEGSANVVVTTLVGASAPIAYTYERPKPVISHISPNLGATNTQINVTITGEYLHKDFDPDPIVTFDGVPAILSQFSSNRLIMRAPANATGGPVEVLVTTNAGTNVIPGQFIYVSPPVVTSLSRAGGRYLGGQSVTIRGERFSAVTDIRFGSTPAASFDIVSDSEIVAVTPRVERDTGAVALQVVDAFGTGSASFVYDPTPTISSISPTSGPEAGGGVITITGTHLSDVEFGAITGLYNRGRASMTILSATDTTVTARTGAYVKSGSPVSPYTSIRLSSYTDEFLDGYWQTTYRHAFTDPVQTGRYDLIYEFTPTPVPPQPNATAMSPTGGPTTGGTVVTITGNDLSNVSSVTFRGKSAQILSNTSTQVTVLSPADRIDSSEVKVTTPGGTSTLAQQFRTSRISELKGVRLDTDAGPVAGGTPVKIVGAALFASTFNPDFVIVPPTRVTFSNEFGSADALIVSYGSTCYSKVDLETIVPCLRSDAGEAMQSIDVIAPSSPLPDGRGGTVNVTVYTPLGQSSPNVATTYHYGAAPVLASLTPSTLEIGATSATLSAAGQGFSANASVQATAADGTVYQAITQVHSDSSLTATMSFPAGVPNSTLSVKVIDPANGDSAAWPILTTQGNVIATSANGYGSVQMANAITVTGGKPGAGILAAARYSSNPAGTDKGLFSVEGDFLDLYVSPDATYSVVTATICAGNTAGTPKFFNTDTQKWEVISPVYWTGSRTNCSAGGFVFTASALSTPSIAELTGTYVIVDQLPATVSEISLNGVPANQLLEATSSAGADFYFEAPVLTEYGVETNTTTCDFDGSTFPLGTTLVNCSALTSGGFPIASQFAVTVEDTTGPVLFVPIDLTVPATGASGGTVDFLVDATDAVTETVDTVCLVAGNNVDSGDLFPIGETSVSCSAGDAAGNLSETTSFTVTVEDVTTVGHMRGNGFVREDDEKYEFQFNLRERASKGESGNVVLKVESRRQFVSGKSHKKKRGKRKHTRDVFRASSIDFVAFNDDPNLEPNRRQNKGKPRVDTVSAHGVGSWNGEAGYRFELNATDEGESGRGHRRGSDRDYVSIVIRDESGEVVAEISDELSGGNIQSKPIGRSKGW